MQQESAVRLTTPHLASALTACGIAIAIICAGRLLAMHLERSTIHLTAPKDFFIKNQGLAFQRAAARRPDILLLYGSSELTDEIPNRASDFFANAPTGFQVCPVGKPGAQSLIISQKIAALGSELRGRKVAISVSPSFFFREDLNAPIYAGNFSLAAASSVLFGTAIDGELKRDMARRMLQFPETLEKSRVLKTAAECIAFARPVDWVVLVAIWPLGQLDKLVLDFQDHFETLAYILAGGKGISHREIRELLDAHERSEDAEQGVKREKAGGSLASRGQAAFDARITGAKEWGDLELLFRTLKQVGAQPFVVSLPLDGNFYDARGIPRSARQVYYDKLKLMAQRYHVALADFEEHDSDPSFQIPRREHPTPTGWACYDQALDQFFHGSAREEGDRSWRR